jgi:uncharacterized membrane protein YoaK (UPF0700 family)
MQTHAKAGGADDGSLTVFTLCFVGGCMDCVSYLLLFHVLLGVMTVNTMIGIIGIIDRKDVHDALLHLSTVLGFLIMVFAHNLIVAARKKPVEAKPTLSCLTLELAIVLVYAVLASQLLRHGQLREPNLVVFALVCLGSFAIYLQNSVVPSARGLPASTMVMTGNYVSLLTHSVNMLMRSGGKHEARHAVKYFLLVHIHFWGGVAVMAWLAPSFDFLALILPCLALGVLILKLKGSMRQAGDMAA